MKAFQAVEERVQNGRLLPMQMPREVHLIYCRTHSLLLLVPQLQWHYLIQENKKNEIV